MDGRNRICLEILLSKILKFPWFHTFNQHMLPPCAFEETLEPRAIAV